MLESPGKRAKGVSMSVQRTHRLGGLLVRYLGLRSNRHGLHRWPGLRLMGAEPTSSVFDVAVLSVAEQGT